MIDLIKDLEANHRKTGRGISIYSRASRAILRLRYSLRQQLAILTHKNISPPMLPGVQEKMAEEIKELLEETM